MFLMFLMFLNVSKFTNEPKPAVIIRANKKRSELSNENYCRPMNILPNFSKTYKRYLYGQIVTYFEKIFSKYQCRFCKGYHAQNCLLATIGKWKKSVYDGGAFGALLTDLSSFRLHSG